VSSPPVLKLARSPLVNRRVHCSPSGVARRLLLLIGVVARGLNQRLFRAIASCFSDAPVLGSGFLNSTFHDLGDLSS